MPLTFANVAESLPAMALAAPAPFPSLDPGILNESIPTFYIGRDRDGFWLARDIKGENGGLFLLKTSALAFARRTSLAAGCATIFASERLEFDLENEGNPLVPYLRPLMRLLQRIANLAAGSREPSDLL